MVKKILTLATLLFFAAGCGQKEIPLPPPPPVARVQVKAPIPKVVDTQQWAEYTVKKGDDLTTIGQEYGWKQNPSMDYFELVQTKNNLQITPNSDQYVVINDILYASDGVFTNQTESMGDGLYDFTIYPDQKLYIPIKKD